MSALGRLLIILGIVFLVLGLALVLWDYLGLPRLGRLPGDITYGHGNFKFYFPLATCIILSALLTLIFYLFRK